MTDASPQVFISYSHDSDQHRQQVLGLSERLRDDGVETRLDQYEPGTPEQGWPRWMLDQLDWAEFVLVVCTATYYRRFRGHEAPNQGQGVDWEGSLITQEIYHARSRTKKFVPVLFDAQDQAFVPEPLGGLTHYVLTAEANYQALLEFLLGQAGVEPRPVRAPNPRPRRTGDALTFPDASTAVDPRVPLELPRSALARQFFGRQQLLAELAARLRRREDTCVWGPAGMGKTALAAEALTQVLGGTGRDALTGSPWPDGIVLLDLYQLKADADKVWDHLANALGPDLPTNRPARDRAAEACRGRQALVIVEGAEEAGDGRPLQDLLAVLDARITRLILTRNKRQDWTGRALAVEQELSPHESQALLRTLTGGRIAEPLLAAVFERLGGHPLALTWAGCQLASGEEPPQAFLRELQAERLPRLQEPGYEDHTVRWLYDRSVRHLSVDARRILVAAGLLAAAPFPRSAAEASLADADSQARGAEALRVLVRHGLLHVIDGVMEAWEFTHALVYQFARATASGDTGLLPGLGAWAIAEFTAAVNQAKRTAAATGRFDQARLRNLVLHAAALLRADATTDALASLANRLLYDGQDQFEALGNLELARFAIEAVAQWHESAPAERRAFQKWQRERSVSHNRVGEVLSAQGDLAGALAAYRASQEIRARLANADPSHAGWQRDLSLPHIRVRFVAERQGDHDAARQEYAAAVAISARLVQLDPTNVTWRKDLDGLRQRLEACRAAD